VTNYTGKYSNQRLLALILVASLVVSTVISTSGAYAVVDADGFENGKTYAVPLAITTKAGYRVQFNEYAMVTKNESSFRVKLQYFSHSIVDAIQIVKPELVTDDVIALFASYSAEMKMGTFNLTGGAYAAATYSGNAWASSEYDSWYLPQDQFVIEQRNQAEYDMDISYISFDLPDLNNKLLMKAFSAVANQAPNTYTVTFNLANAVEMPEYIKRGDSTLSFQVTNVIGDAMTLDGAGRNASTYVNRIKAALLTTSPAAVSVDDDSMNITLSVATTAAGLSTNIFVAAYTPVKRALQNVAEGRSYLSEQWNISGFQSLNAGEYSFSYQSGIDYEDWVFGRQIRFSTNTGTRINNNVGPYEHIGIVHLLPTEDIVGDDATGIEIDADTGSFVPATSEPADDTADFTDNGVALRLSTSINDETVTFSAPDYKSFSDEGVAWRVNEVEFNYYTSEALTPEDYLAYSVSFVNSGMQPVEPVNATLSFSIPEDWAPEKIKLVFLKSSESTRNLSYFTIDYVSRQIILPINKYAQLPLNMDFIFVHAAEPIDPTAQITENGVYKVRIAAMHATQNILSMSHNAIGKSGYIEKDADGLTLYISLGMAEGEGISGLTRNMYIYSGNRDNFPPMQSEHLGYASNSDGSLNTDNYATDYNFVYPNRISVPLGAPDTGNTYWVRWDIPAMDDLTGTPGDYSGTRDARLFIFAPEKVESGVNPYAGHDKTVIRAELDAANRLLASGGLFDAGEAFLATAIEQAQEVYNTNPTDDETIVAARDALRVAVAALPKLDLNTLLASAAQYTEESYTPDSWAIFAEALTAAQNAAADNTATQETINGAANALREAIAGLYEKSAPVDKSALTAKLAEARAIQKGNYTDASWSALRTAITTAEAVASDTGATQTAVNAQVTALQNAINALAVEKTALDNAIAAAKAYPAANYEDTSYNALAKAISVAEVAVAGTLTDAQITKQITALNTAVSALVAKSDLKTHLADGEHSLAGKTKLMQYGANADSMGNTAIDHSKSYLEVSNNGGNARVHLFFGPLTSANLTGYLLTLDKVTQLYYQPNNPTIVDRYDVEAAQVHEDWGDAHDDFWQASYGPYPKHLSIPVTPGEAETIVHVFVPVMYSISPTSGDQLARLIIDWSGFDLTGGATAPNLNSLNAAIAQTQTGLTQSDYAPASWQSLAASVAAGEYLKANAATLTVTQDMTDKRAAAILAAKDALLAAPAGGGEATKPPANGEPTEPPVVTPPATQPETPITKTPEATESVAVGTPAITETAAGGKKAESTVTETTANVTAKASSVVADATKKAAERNAPADEVIVAELRIDATPADTTGLTETVTKVPKDVIAAIIAESAEAKTENANVELVLTVDGGLAAVTLDGAALADIVKDAGESETVTITVVANATGTLTEQQMRANVIPEGKVPFSIEIAVGDKQITAFSGDTKIAVTIPAPAPPAAGKKFVVWYVPANGDAKTKHEAVYEGGKLTFATDRI
jgi:hypothetical protein